MRVDSSFRNSRVVPQERPSEVRRGYVMSLRMKTLIPRRNLPVRARKRPMSVGHVTFRNACLCVRDINMAHT